MVWQGQPKRVTVPYTKSKALVRYLSTAGHEKSGGNLGRPLPKAKYTGRPIVEQYHEGKVKRTPARGVK